MHNFTVTIGIPALNEGHNIKSLIMSLIGQKADKFILEKVIVYSDGSTDNTNEEVESIGDTRILLICGDERMGQMHAQNTIIQKTTSDILVLINGDTSIQDERFIEKLIAPFGDDSVGMTSPKIVPLEPKNLFENIIAYSHEVKTKLYEGLTNKDNIHLCHGRGRALTKKFYKNLVFENLMAEDAYSFILCKKLDLNFKYVSDASLYFRSPQNLKDHINQSSRYFCGRDELIKRFGKDELVTEYKIDKVSLFSYTLQGLVYNPIYTLLFAVIYWYAQLIKIFSGNKFSYLWSVSKTSKNVSCEAPKNNYQKIEVVTKYFYPVTAGIENNILQTYKKLKNNGWDVHIHTSKDTLTDKNILNDSDLVEGLKVTRYKSNAFGFKPKIEYQNVSHICLHNFTVFPHLTILLKTLLYKLIGKKNYVLFLTPHGGFNPEWRIFSYTTAFIKGVYHRTLGMLLINLAVDGVRAISIWEQKALMHTGILKSKIIVIPNGIEDVAFSDVDKGASASIKNIVNSLNDYILVIGRVFPIKNIETIIKALPNVDTKIKLAIAGPIGDVKYKEKLDLLAEKLDVNKRIIYLGVITGTDKFFLLKKALVMVHMAIWESFCNVVHEAMSMGAVCIVANNTALKYLVENGKNGFLIPTRNEKALAQKIEYVFQNVNNDEMMEIRKHNMSIGEEHSWSTTAMKMEQTYRGLFEKLLFVKKSGISKAFGLFIWGLMLVLLLISIKGYTGNPTVEDLNSNTWKENGPFELSPERGRFALTYSLLEDKSFYFSVPIARFATPDLGIKNGNYVSLFAPAVSFLVMPGYLLGRYFGAAQVGAFSIIALIALINAYLIKRITQKLTGMNAIAYLSALVFVFATPAYAYATTLYQHHVSVFLILMSIHLLLSYRSFLSLALIWMLCAFSIPVDYPNLILMLPIGVAAFAKIVWFENTAKDITVKIALSKILTFSFVLIPFLYFTWFNINSYGRYIQLASTVGGVQAIDEYGKPVASSLANTDEQDKFVNPEAKQRSAVNFFKTRHMLNSFYILTISRDRGVLTYTPVILLGIVGMYFLIMKNSYAAKIMIGVILFNFLLYSMRSDSWGGWAFGSRYLVPAYAMLSIGIGVLLANIRGYWKIAVTLIFSVLFAYSVYVNTVGALTTNALPPQVEVLGLEKITGKVQLFSYDKGIDFLNNNRSKSFVFQSYVKDKMSAWEFFYKIYASILVTTLGVYILYLKEVKNAQIK